jgi:hypothetical protein
MNLFLMKFFFTHFFDEVYALYLLSFDLSNEVFLTTLMRLENDSLDIEFAESGLTMLNEFVALILNYTQVNTFHISILGEIDVKKSWIILHCLLSQFYARYT